MTQKRKTHFICTVDGDNFYLDDSPSSTICCLHDYSSTSINIEKMKVKNYSGKEKFFFKYFNTGLTLRTLLAADIAVQFLEEKYNH